MKHRQLSSGLFTFVFVMLVSTSPTLAQASRTWVSSTAWTRIRAAGQRRAPRSLGRSRRPAPVARSIVSIRATSGTVGRSSGTAVAIISKTRITNAVVGVAANIGSRLAIRQSTIYLNDWGVLRLLLGNQRSTVAMVKSTLGFSSFAALQSLSGDLMLAFGNTFVNNVLDFDPAGGAIFTGGDNNNSGSATGSAKGGTVPKI